MAKKHFEIDLETMGLRKTAAFMSIGIAYFNETEILDTFYTTVNLQSCIDAGLTTTPSTIKWWADQPAETRAAWEVADAPSMIDALTTMCQFFRKHATRNELCPWSNGADFDIAILSEAFTLLDLDIPWQFYNQFCHRTMISMFPSPKIPFSGIKHHAMHDAIHQAKQLQNSLALHTVHLPR